MLWHGEFQAPRLVHPAWVSLIVLMVLCCGANAELLVYEPFDYPAGTALDTSNGGFGFDSDWGVRSQSSGHVAAGSLAWESLRVSGNSLYTPETASGTAWITRNLAEPEPGQSDGTSYVSFLLRPELAPGQDTPGGFVGMSLINTFASQTGGELFMGWAAIDKYTIENLGGAGRVISELEPVFEQTAFFVLKAEFRTGIDKFTLYINPTIGEPEPATGLVKEDIDLNRVLAVGIRSSGEFTMDEIRIGETYADVTPQVPEPGGLCLLVSGGLALLATSLRRLRLRRLG